MSDIPQDIIIEAYKAVAGVATFPSTDRMELLDRVAAAILAERERCAKIAKEISYIEGTDFGSVNAIRFGWPEIGECQHGKFGGETCPECPKEAREEWWLKEPME